MKSAKQPTHGDDAPRLRVLLVDDHPGVREGLAVLLETEGIVVCAKAGRRTEAVASISLHQPAVAIVDLSLDGEDGVMLISELHHRGVPVLVYSMHTDARHLQGAIAAGALGYVTKRASHQVLVQGIREVASGRRFLSPVAAAVLAESLTEPSGDDGIGKLSENERNVYEMLGKGADSFEIAGALHISSHTVESYYSRILVKLKLSGMHELRRHAVNHLHNDSM